jgi:hypothetical protein
METKYLLLGLGILGAVLLGIVLLGRGQGVSYSVPNRFGMQEAENEETLEWTDWRGVQRKLTIHRTVRVKT